MYVSRSILYYNIYINLKLGTKNISNQNIPRRKQKNSYFLISKPHCLQAKNVSKLNYIRIHTMEFITIILYFSKTIV